MLDVCTVCDDLVDVDYRYQPGFDRTQPVFCGGSQCLRPVSERYLCQCRKRCRMLLLTKFGDNDQVERPACPDCIQWETDRRANTEVLGHPV